MATLSRREFIAILSAAGAAAASSGWLVSRLFAMVEEGTIPPPRGPGVEQWIPSLCRLCPASCGIRVRLVDGLPVGLEGNSTNPVSRGGLCPAGLAGLQELVHPDRVRTPLRREGPRGSGRWAALSWEDALEEVGASLRRLRGEGRPEAFAVLERGDSPLTRFWIERTLQTYGSPNLLVDETGEPWRVALAYAADAARDPAPDLAHSDFILSFGHELFETDGHPVWQSQVWGALRAPTEAPAVTMAYVGPRLSPSAIRADMRVAVRPGTEATLALGLVYVLILEDLVNRSFLEHWTSGYGRPEGESTSETEGFEDFVRRHYYPERVSRITGATTREIFRLGRAFGSARRQVALVGPTALSGARGLATAMAVLALNAAVGSIGRSGGYVAPGSAPFDLPAALKLDDVARRGLSMPRVDGAGRATLPLVRQSAANLVRNLAARKPYPIEVLLIHGVNPVHEWPEAKAVEVALASVRLVVAVGPVPDETARAADLVLPEASFLETWQLIPAGEAIPFDYAGLQQPAVKPLYQSRSFEDMWFDLARNLGAPVSASVPEGTYERWIPVAAAGLYRSGRGTIASDLFRERIADFMERRGWQAPGPESASAFWNELKRSGSWVDGRQSEPSPETILGPNAPRLHFFPSRLHRDLETLTGSPLPRAALYTGISERENGEEPSSPSGRDRPFQLLLFDTNTLWSGRTAGTPLMLEMAGFREDIAWDTWLLIHPEAARINRIEEGGRVRIETTAGRVVVRARLSVTVPRDAVAMPRGLGHRHFGQFATGVGANPMELIPARAHPWTGAFVLETRCRLAPAGA